MTCKRLRCLLFGHPWRKACVVRLYGKSIQVFGPDITTLTTGQQLFCTRSEEWVNVKHRTFENYYEKECRQFDYNEEPEVEQEGCEHCGDPFCQ